MNDDLRMKALFKTILRWVRTSLINPFKSSAKIIGELRRCAASTMRFGIACFARLVLLASLCRPYLKRLMRLVLGITFLLVGFIGLFLPILQGILFLCLGMLCLSYDVPLFRRWLVFAQRRHRFLRPIVKKWKVILLR